MTVKLLTEQHLQFSSLKGGCTGSSESILVKMQHCWKSHVAAQLSWTSSLNPDLCHSTVFCPVPINVFYRLPRILTALLHVV